jgi:uncharacterized protein
MIMRRSLVLAMLGEAVLVTSMLPAFAQETPPPWCGQGGRKNAAELTVCRTRSLWHVDDTLNLSYAFAMDRLSPAQKRILESSQADWLRETRNPCGSDVRCLHKAYQARMNTLDDINNRGHF